MILRQLIAYQGVIVFQSLNLLPRRVYPVDPTVAVLHCCTKLDHSSLSLICFRTARFTHRGLERNVVIIFSVIAGFLKVSSEPMFLPKSIHHVSLPVGPDWDMEHSRNSISMKSTGSELSLRRCIRSATSFCSEVYAPVF